MMWQLIVLAMQMSSPKVTVAKQKQKILNVILKFQSESTEMIILWMFTWIPAFVTTSPGLPDESGADFNGVWETRPPFPSSRLEATLWQIASVKVAEPGEI